MEALQHRWVRLPLMFAAGLGLAVLGGLWGQPYYLDICRRVNEGLSCTPITTTRLTGYLAVGIGVIVLILGPVVNSLYHLYRHGQIWETPRGPETIVTNIPIAVGFVYMVVGVVIAAAG